MSFEEPNNPRSSEIVNNQIQLTELAMYEERTPAIIKLKQKHGQLSKLNKNMDPGPVPWSRFSWLARFSFRQLWVLGTMNVVWLIAVFIVGVDRLSAPILSTLPIIDIGHFKNRFADNYYYYYYYFFLCKQTYYLQVTLFIGE